MINLHSGQSEVYKDLFVTRACRFSTVNCSRGWGKSYMAGTAAITAIFELLELADDVPNKVVYIIAPTYDQVTDIYYPLINFDLGMEAYALSSSRDTGRFVFPGNVELRLLSYESVERMRGKGAYFVVWDEISSCKKGVEPKEAWESVIKPCITTRWSKKRAKIYGAKSVGRALLIGTPKGFNYFHTVCHFYEVDKQWKYYHYDYKASPLLDISEIDQVKETMDPIKFASEYLANFEESGNAVFYCFKRDIHIKSDLAYFAPPEDGEMGEDVHINIDFNVGNLCKPTLNLVNSGKHSKESILSQAYTERCLKVQRLSLWGVRHKCGGSARQILGMKNYH